MTTILRAGVIWAVWASVSFLYAADDKTAPYSVGCYGTVFPGVNSVTWERVPYYALYPPVYYSYPVPRPYGYSPFAYPPGTMTPEPPEPKPLVIENRFVPKKAVQSVKRDQVAAAPLRIVNPYVVMPEDFPKSEAISTSTPVEAATENRSGQDCRNR